MSKQIDRLHLGILMEYIYTKQPDTKSAWSTRAATTKQTENNKSFDIIKMISLKRNREKRKSEIGKSAPRETLLAS